MRRSWRDNRADPDLATVPLHCPLNGSAATDTSSAPVRRRGTADNGAKLGTPGHRVNRACDIGALNFDWRSAGAVRSDLEIEHVGDPLDEFLLPGVYVAVGAGDRDHVVE